MVDAEVEVGHGDAEEEEGGHCGVEGEVCGQPTFEAEVVDLAEGDEGDEGDD